MGLSKWTVLVLACFITFGAYYSFDFPSVLHNQLFQHFKLKDEKFDSFELDFSLIYSVYSLPNTIIPLLGGLLVDKFGNKRIMFAFGIFVLLGNFIQSYACVARNISMYILGRFIFGFGAETLGVCANTIISKWFKGQELAFAMAINLSACKLAGVLNDWISPVVEVNYGVVVTSYSVSGVCFVCFLLTILLIIMEPPDNAELRLAREQHRPENNAGHIELGSTSYFQASNSDGADSDPEKQSVLQEVQEFSAITKNSRNKVVDNEVLRHSVSTTVKSSDGAVVNQENTIEYFRHSTEVSEISGSGSGGCSSFLVSMGQLNAAVWLIFILTFLMYGVFVPFTNLSNPILLEFFFDPSADPQVVKQNQVSAAYLQSVPYFLSVFLNPVLGISIDLLGGRTALMSFSALVLLLGHLFIYEHDMGPILPLALIGFAYSIFASVVWACVPMVVGDDLTGTAFGVMAAFQNSAQFVVPLILQRLISLDGGSYLSCEAFFVSFAAVALALSLVLWVVDERYFDGIMRKPSEVLAQQPKLAEYSPLTECGQQDCQADGLDGAADRRGNMTRLDFAENGGSEPSVFHKMSPRLRSRFDSLSTSPHSRRSDGSSPETTLISTPIAIISIPKNVQPMTPRMALIAGQFSKSDALELRRMMSERERHERHVPMAFSMVTPGSHMKGGIAAVASPVEEKQQQQFLQPKRLTRSTSFHSFSQF